MRPPKIFMLALAVLSMQGSAATLDQYRALLAAGDAQGLASALASANAAMPRSERHESLLHLASSYHHAKNQPALIRVLLDGGADPNVRADTSGAPLHWAAGYGCVECVRLLLAAGAELEARNARGYTALHVATAECAKLLIAAGAQIGARDNEGSLPLHRAYHDALLPVGVNVRNNFGFTPLHFAALSGNDKAIQWLLRHGADPRAESSAEYRFKDGVLAERWDPELRIERGWRPYDIARWRHDRSKWSTGTYRRSLELLDAATPRRSWFSR